MQHWATPESADERVDDHLGAVLNGKVAKHGNGRLIRSGYKPYQSHESLSVREQTPPEMMSEVFPI